MNSQEEEDGGGGGTDRRSPRLSCTKCFDALWFCYFPIHVVGMEDYQVGIQFVSGKGISLKIGVVVPYRQYYFGLPLVTIIGGSPVHQMQQYYRHGEFDNCFDKWNTLFDCLKLKTKKTSEVQEILEARENAKPHIWTFRTVEEASAHWKKLYGRGVDY